MKRRSFFGVVAGGICAALGLKVGDCSTVSNGLIAYTTTTYLDGKPTYYERAYRVENSVITVQSDACLDHCNTAEEANEAAKKGTWQAWSCERVVR